MAKQLNVNLNFTADTSAAEANLASLKSQLTEISSMGAGKNASIMGPELQTAINSAKELNKHLASSFNPKTGNLNLTAFQQSLTKSNQSLSTLSQNLLGAGKAGQQAFMNLQNGIAAANIQLNKTQTLLGTFATTFMNTLRWQATSSIIHGISGGISQAVGYAKDLNKTLTDIRIVAPEKSLEDMAKFAKQANQSAKELSSTTLDYAKGALIYYQQGLEDADVKARTDVTTKMANVTGDSTDEVSSYMTAIWNNFNKAGDESEEHFADILTKLGAETAASTTEITTSLEKYTGVANTIGLSYESATAAATTLIDRMRETPEVAGTALKTIFARMEGLKLNGEIAESEDGPATTLNKYSQALHQIGVEIKDQNGDMRQADDILMDMGHKWQTLAQDQKIATAQTVAGVRQWQIFSALMDNFKYFEEYKNMAEYGSGGALQEQQEIYAESWEAASNRVKTAWQDIYAQIFDDRVFIKITDAFGLIVESIDTTVKTMGGLRGMILLISSLLLSKFSANVTLGLETGITKLTAKFSQLGTTVKSVFKGNFLSSLTTANKAIKDGTSLLNQESQAVLRIVQANQALPQSFRNQASQLERINTITNQIASLGGLISKGQQEQLQNELNFVQALTKEEAIANETFEAEQRKLTLLESEIRGQAILTEQREGEASLILENAGLYSEESSAITKIIAEQKKMMDSMGNASTILRELVSLQEEFATIQSQGLGSVEKENELFEQRLTLLREQGGIYETIAKEIQGSYAETTNYNDSLSQTVSLVEKIVNALTQTKDAGQSLSQGMRTVEQSATKAAVATEKVEASLKGVTSALAGIGSKGFSTLGQIPKMVSALSSAALSASMISSAIKTLGDEDASVMDKFVSSSMALAFTMGTLQQMATGIREAFTAYQVSVEAMSAAELSNLTIKGGLLTAEQAEAELALEKFMIDLQGATALGMYNEEKAKEAMLFHLTAMGLTKDSELTEFNTVAKIKAGVASGILTEKQGEEAMSALAGAAANETFAASFAAMLAPIAFVIAMLGLVALGIRQTYKDAHQARDAFKEINETNRDLIENAENAKDKLSSMSDSLEEIKDKASELQKIDMGTAKWTKEVGEHNEKVKELITNYNKLNDSVQNQSSARGQDALKEVQDKQKEAGYTPTDTLDFVEGEDWNNVNGIWEFTEAGQIKVDTITSIAAQEAQISVNSANIVTNRAEEEAALEQFNADHNGSLGTAGSGYQYNVVTGEYEITGGMTAGEVAQIVLDAAKKDDEFSSTNLADEKWLQENTNLNQGIIDQITSSKTTQEDIYGLLQNINDNKEQELLDNQQLISQNAALQEKISGALSESDLQEYGTGINERMGQDMAGIIERRSGWSLDTLVEKSGYENAVDAKRAFASTANLEYRDGKYYELDENRQATGEGKDESAYEKDLKTFLATDQALKQMEKDYKKYTKEVEDSKDDWKSLDKIKKAYEEQSEALEKVRKSNKKAFSELDDEGKEAIKKFAKDTKKELAQALDVGKDKNNILNKDFYTKNLPDIKKAMEGNLKSLEKVRNAYEMENVKAEALNIAPEITIDEAQYTDAMQDLQSILDTLPLEKKVDVDTLGARDEINALLSTMTSAATEFDAKSGQMVGSAQSAQAAIAALMAAGMESVDVGDLEWVPLPDENGTESTETTAEGLEAEVTSKPMPLPKANISTSGSNGNMSINSVTGVAGTVNIPEFTYSSTGAETVKTETKKTSSGLGYWKYVGKGGKIGNQGGTIGRGGGGGGGGRAPGGGGGGGGGGGRRGRRARAARHEAKDNKIDRYHDVTKAIEKIQRAQEKADEMTDRLYGKKRINNMEKVNQKLKEELKAIQAKNKLTNKYISLERERLAQELKYYQNKTKKDKDGVKWGQITNVLKGKSFQFDEFGNITNYNDIMNKLQERRDYYVDQMNKKTTEEKQKDYKEKWIDPLDEIIDHLQGYVDAYEEELATLLEQIDNWSEQYNQILENNLEAANYEIEFRVQINDNAKAWIDYYLEKIEDDIYKIGELYNKLFLDNNSTLANLIDKTNIYTDKIYKNAFDPKAQATTENYLEHMTKLYQSGQITQQGYVDALQKEYDALLDNASALEDLKDKMEDYYSNVLNEIMDKLNNYIDRIEYGTDALNHLMNVMELTADGKDYKKLIDLQSRIVAQAERKYNNSLITYQNLLKEYQEAEANFHAKPFEDDEAREKAEKELNDFLNQVQEAGQEVMGNYEDMLDAAHQLLETKLEQAAKDVEEVISGVAGGFEELTRQMDLSSNRQEEYLTKTNQVYEMNKMLRTLRADIDKTDNKAAKQRLGNFAKELEQLKQKDELSQLELDIAQARYKQLQAQIALEEAQNAKSTVRLMRDNEGNYGYVYTANEDKVSDAQQALEDATNALYNIYLNAENDYNQKIINYASDMYKAIKEIQENTDLTEGEKADRITKIREQYGKLIDDATDLLGIANQGLVNEFSAYTEAWTNEYNDTVGNILNNLDSGVDDWLNQINVIKDEYQKLQDKYLDIMNQVVDKALDIADQGQEEFETELVKMFGPDGVMDQAFESLYNFLTDNEKGLPGINTALKNIEDIIKELYEKIFNETFNQGAVDSFYHYNKLMNYVQGYNEAGEMKYNSNGALNFTNSSYDFGEAIAADEAKAEEIWHLIELGARGWIGLDKDGRLAFAKNANGRKDDNAYKESKSQLAKPLLKFASGGYTGEWGSEEGKLAMLHEKELVLNQKDTENMLAAVDLVRDIVQMIDMNVLSTAANISATNINPFNQELDQNVTITAEFPNATDRNEIEAAFENLVNRAAQYANRN